MRPCSAALKSFLEGSDRDAIIIDLYTFTLTTGEVFRFSAGNATLTVPAAGFPSGSINAGADRFFALGPRFGRSKVTTKIGVEPAELDIDVYAAASDTLGGLSWASAVRQGMLDGATVELDRLFAPAPGAGAIGLDMSLGCLVWFFGDVAECDIGRSAIHVKVKALVNRLSIRQWPRRIYTGPCNHVFGGAMCGYDRVAGANALGASTGWGAVTITAASGTTQSEIHASYTPGLSPSPYIQGTIVGLTGANAGYSRTISDHTAGVVTVRQEFLFPISVGDTFRILPGCPHTSNYCDTVLNNLGRFGGFPHIPPPEAAI
jgi:hypothetical protein